MTAEKEIFEKYGVKPKHIYKLTNAPIDFCVSYYGGCKCEMRGDVHTLTEEYEQLTQSKAHNVILQQEIAIKEQECVGMQGEIDDAKAEVEKLRGEIVTRNQQLFKAQTENTHLREALGKIKNAPQNSCAREGCCEDCNGGEMLTVDTVMENIQEITRIVFTKGELEKIRKMFEKLEGKQATYINELFQELPKKPNKAILKPRLLQDKGFPVFYDNELEMEYFYFGDKRVNIPPGVSDIVNNIIKD